LALAALLTAFYTMRQITLTFLGEPRSRAAEHASESKASMTVPLVVLAVFAVSAGWVGIPKSFPVLGGLLPPWFEEFVGSMLVSVHAEVASFSLVPLETSLVVALGGLYLGWLVYRNVKAGAADPMLRLGGLFTLLKNKYYVDELYDLVFVRPARWLAETFSSQWIDRGLLDGILHGLGRFGLWLGRLLRHGFDQPVLNGLADGASSGTGGLGSFMRRMQTGKVQQYMLAAVLVLVVVGLILYYLIRV
jgi:NADH-quinone oxidoreductase subunit L